MTTITTTITGVAALPADDLALTWLDYPTLARRLGTTHDAARQRAKRGRWARRRGNDGGWLVGVPIEVLDRPDHDHDPPGDHDHNHDHEGDHDHDHAAVINAITTTFTQHIDRLEQALASAQEKAAALEMERDAARGEALENDKARSALAAQVEALNTVLAVERERIERERRQADERLADERRQADERIAAERQRADDWKLAADRFAAQAETLARPRGLFGWLRRA